MNTQLAADRSFCRTTFETIQSLFAIRRVARSRTETMFVVRARFVGAATKVMAADSLELFLDNNGHWRSIENAMHFKAREAAEASVYEARRRIRNTGNRMVSVSLLPLTASSMLA